MNGLATMPARPTPTPPAPSPVGAAAPLRPKFVQPLIAYLLRKDPEYLPLLNAQRPNGALLDFILATPDDLHAPGDIFPRLRWGGVFVFASPHAHQAAEVAQAFADGGFALEEGPARIHQRIAGLVIPLLCPRTHYFIARKMQLIPPGQITERFTYQVQLEHHPEPDGPLVVVKEVPSLESVVERLHKKFPESDLETLQRRAEKFIERIFPTFLTREAAILRILEDHLPKPYNRRVPRVIHLEKDDKGFVRKLRMSWLRNGGSPLGQMEFAHQSADLLRAIHDMARVIHLDLRLDNFVITPEGVGFVDFGSAVREGEKLSQNPIVGSLFEELMRTSQIQRMLNQMMQTGHVTSDIIRRSQHKVDKAVDFFYLAVQFNCPHSNPDLADLIEYDPASEDAKELAKLTADILRPANPAKPTFRSARDILYGIERIQRGA